VTEDGGLFEGEFCVSPGHPAIPGHFPGNPVVPGVLVLDQVLDAASAAAGREMHVTSIEQLKFLSPLLPGENCRVTGELHTRTLRFSATRGDTVIARGTLGIAFAAANSPGGRTAS
jgi:3-hydroxymyristoyl/3-hydroxydecanoyl-(acyl carrier protein) dehydratase